MQLSVRTGVRLRITLSGHLRLEAAYREVPV